MIKKSYKKRIPPVLVNLYRYFYNRVTPIIYFIIRKKKLHIYAGIPLNIYICDPVSKAWYDHDFERDEIKFLRQNNLKTGATVFNIGAHHGVVALILSKIVGRSGRVVAVEMDKHHVSIAHINKKSNNASNLSIIHAAAAEKSGIVSFSHDQVQHRGKTNHILSVRSITLDEITRRYGLPSVLYIDVEGYECNVLKGAKKTLRHYPDCCIEVHVNHGLENFGGSVEKLLSYFSMNKYNLYMAPAIHKCKFKPYNPKSDLIKDRFYLVALNKPS